jgi:hypothetical protein
MCYQKSLCYRVPLCVNCIPMQHKLQSLEKMGMSFSPKNYSNMKLRQIVLISNFWKSVSGKSITMQT